MRSASAGRPRIVCIHAPSTARNGCRRRPSSSSRLSQRANVASRPSRNSLGTTAQAWAAAASGSPAANRWSTASSGIPLAANHAAARRCSRLGGAAVALELREEVLAQQRVVAEPAALACPAARPAGWSRPGRGGSGPSPCRRRRRRTGRPTCGRGSPSAAGTRAPAASRGRGARRRGSRRCRCPARRRRPVPASAAAAVRWARRAARYTAAGQPSVRAWSSRASSARSSRPSRAASIPASCSSNARSSTPISTSLPFARRRATGSPPSVRPADGDRDPARQVVDDHRQRVGRSRAGDVVHVVEHEHHRQPGGVERRGEPRDGERQRGLSVQRDAVEDRGREVERPLDREADIAEEADRVGIGGVARHPRHGAPLPGPPQREARGLAVAGRRDHRHQAGVGAQELPDEGVALQDGRPEVRRGELRLDQRLPELDRRGAQRRGQGTVDDGARRPRRMSAPLPPVAQHAPAGHRPPASPLRGEAAPTFDERGPVPRDG